MCENLHVMQLQLKEIQDRLSKIEEDTHNIMRKNEEESDISRDQLGKNAEQSNLMKIFLNKPEITQVLEKLTFSFVISFDQYSLKAASCYCLVEIQIGLEQYRI